MFYALTFAAMLAAASNASVFGGSEKATYTSERARATVTVLRPVIVDEGVWERSPASQRKEVVRVEPDGTKILLRVVEFE